MVDTITFAQSTQHILPHVNTFVHLFPYILSKNTKTVLRNLCKQIHQSAKHPPTYTYNNIADMSAFIANTKQYNDFYSGIPEIIRDKIESNAPIGRTYTIHMHGHHITVHLVLPKPLTTDNKYSRIYYSEDLSDSFFESCIHKIIVWLGVALPYAGKTCAKKLSCYLFLTDHTKILPKKNKPFYLTQKNEQHIHQEHANTAFTTACTSKSIIMLYRMEEWFKVFIHETFHCLGLDFSGMNVSNSNKQILQLFPGCSRNMDVRVYETYCEIWAETLNVLFISYFSERPSRVFTKSILKTNKRKTQRQRPIVQYSRNFSKMITKAEEFIQHERAFTMYQATKVLKHYNLTYTDVINNTTTATKPYSENTPVFSYYILKCILLYHFNEFIEWCNVHNGNAKILYFKKTNDNIREYGELIGRLYKTDDFIKKMETLQSTPDAKRKEYEETPENEVRRSLMQYNTLEKTNEMTTTMRMSLYEI